MFNQLILNTESVDDFNQAYVEPGSISFSRLPEEERYLRSIYPVVVFEPEEYITRRKEDNYFIKSAEISDEIGYESLVHEVYMTLRLSDGKTNLQRVIDVKFTHTHMYAVFHYIEGLTLFDLVNKYFLSDEEPNMDEFMSVVSSALEQLDYLYSSYSFTHYDLHPGNIIMDETGKVTIIDLEFASAVFDGNDHGVQLLSENDLNSLITPDYYWPFDMFKLICFVKHTIINMKKNAELRHLSTSAMDLSEESRRDVDEMHKTTMERLNVRLPRNKLEKLIDILLSYFMDPLDFEDYSMEVTYYAAPRIDRMKKYNKYLTNFEHFYAYYNNIVNLLSN